MNLYQDMSSYVDSHYPILYLVTFEEEAGDSLIRELASDRKRKVQEWNLARGFVRFDNKVQMTDYMDLPAALDNWLDQEDQYLNNRFLVVRDAHLALRDNPLAITRLKALVHRIIHNDNVTATVFLVSSQPCVPPELEQFITVFEQPPPEKDEIKQIIRNFGKDHRLSVDQKVTSELALAFRGLSEYQIRLLLNRGFRRGGELDINDVKLVIDEKRQIVKRTGILEMVSVTEGMDDIAGLRVLKEWLERKAKIMDSLPEAWESGVETPKGAMIVGMPGCGKSLTAKATSVRLRLPLLRLDIGSLMGRYVGDSEANMRRALALAETVCPCVLWVDELEKAFAGIGDGSTGGGRTGAGSEITSRLFGYFLTWMQEKTKPVFVLATANNVALPPELLRKGRFDEIFYVDFPDEDERVAILEVHLKKRKKDDLKIDVKQLAGRTDGFSGADLEGVIKDAIEDAFLDNKADLKTAHLLESIEKNKPHAMMMKSTVEEYRKKFKEMGIRSASIKANTDDPQTQVAYEIKGNRPPPSPS